MSNFVELSVGMTTEGIDVRSVGNTLTLHETALVEAFNLKAAIEYQLKNCKSVLMHAHFIQAFMMKFFYTSIMSFIIHFNSNQVIWYQQWTEAASYVKS